MGNETGGTDLQTPPLIRLPVATASRKSNKPTINSTKISNFSVNARDTGFAHHLGATSEIDIGDIYEVLVGAGGDGTSVSRQRLEIAWDVEPLTFD